MLLEHILSTAMNMDEILPVTDTGHSFSTWFSVAEISQPQCLTRPILVKKHRHSIDLLFLRSLPSAEHLSWSNSAPSLLLAKATDMQLER
jgi:hypothetical protein